MQKNVGFPFDDSHLSKLQNKTPFQSSIYMKGNQNQFIIIKSKDFDECYPNESNFHEYVKINVNKKN